MSAVDLTGCVSLVLCVCVCLFVSCLHSAIMATSIRPAEMMHWRGCVCVFDCDFTIVIRSAEILGRKRVSPVLFLSFPNKPKPSQWDLKSLVFSWKFKIKAVIRSVIVLCQMFLFIHCVLIVIWRRFEILPYNVVTILRDASIFFLRCFYHIIRLFGWNATYVTSSSLRRFPEFIARYLLGKSFRKMRKQDKKEAEWGMCACTFCVRGD